MVQGKGNEQGTTRRRALPRRQWHREVSAEWFCEKGTSKVRREKEHCRDGSGTGESGNKFPYSIGGFAAGVSAWPATFVWFVILVLGCGPDSGCRRWEPCRCKGCVYCAEGSEAQGMGCPGIPETSSMRRRRSAESSSNPSSNAKPDATQRPGDVSAASSTASR